MIKSTAYHIILSFFVFLLSVPLFAQVDNSTLLWRGFEHAWTYNHRINRLGNYIEKSEDGFYNVHVSASGLGADSTAYVSHFTSLQADNISTIHGKQNIKLIGKEKQLLYKTIEVAIPIEKPFDPDVQFITVLNGFDLMAVERADKVQMFRLSVENANYEPEIQELRFNLKVALVVNCQSFECSKFNQKTVYDLNIHYQVICAKPSDMGVTYHTTSKHYPWGKKDEGDHIPDKKQLFSNQYKTFNAATLAIQSMALTLNTAHWTVQYNNNITPLRYDKGSGQMIYSLDLFFKEWQQGMKDYSARPKHSAWSSKKKGWCVLDMGIIMLQFPDAKIRHHKIDGHLNWDGYNAPSDSPKAINRKKIDLK